MASKNVLREAINKLEAANMTLREKLHETSDKGKKNTIEKEMAKNQAMILDYNFRLEQEND